MEFAGNAFWFVAGLIVGQAAMIVVLALLFGARETPAADGVESLSQ